MTTTTVLNGRRRAELSLMRTVLDAATGCRTRREHHISARTLSRMDNHMLTDIGVTRLDPAFGRTPHPH